MLDNIPNIGSRLLPFGILLFHPPSSLGNAIFTLVSSRKWLLTSFWGRNSP